MIKPGEEWGTPTAADPDLEVAGSDADLAAAVAGRPGTLVRFRPDTTSDFAGAVGLDRAVRLGVELPLDLLRIDGEPPRSAVNMVVLGTPPFAPLQRIVKRFVATVRIDDRTAFERRCTSVVIASGQFRHGLDLVPRGHPGDGRAEVQVYAVAARQRRELRARLATGTHVPHPDITQRSGAHVTVQTDRPVALEIDGRPAHSTDLVEITVVPNAFRLLL